MQILNTVQSVYRLVAILCLIEYNITSTNQAKGYMFLQSVHYFDLLHFNAERRGLHVQNRCLFTWLSVVRNASSSLFCH